MQLIRFVIIMLYFGCWISCSHNITRQKTSNQCQFYPERLEVRGNDLSNDFNINIPETGIYLAILRLHNDQNRPLRPLFNNKDLLWESVSFKISQCKDTTWAKQQILKEIYKKWHVTEKDTIVQQKYYYIYVSDTTKFPPIISQYPYERWFGFDANNCYYNSRKYVEYISRVMYALMNAYEHNNIEIFYDKKTFERKIPGYFNFTILCDFEFLNCPLDEIKRYARDSMGLDFVLTQEKFVPIKKIIF